MRDFTKVSNSIWNSTKFNALQDDQAKLAYLYILTCPHSNSSGCYTLKEGYAAADLGWGFEAIAKAIRLLSEAGLIEYDRASETVRIVNWVTFNPPTNAKHALGILGHLKSAASVKLKRQTLQEFSECIAAKGFNNDPKSGEALVKAIQSMFELYRKGIATKTETETKTESRPDQDTERDRDAQSDDCLAADFAAAPPNGAARPPSGKLPEHFETAFQNLKTQQGRKQA